MIIPDEACKIWISNPCELREFLTACENQDVRWRSGRKALAWIDVMHTPMYIVLAGASAMNRMMRGSSARQFRQYKERDITTEFFAGSQMPDPHTVLEAAWI